MDYFDEHILMNMFEALIYNNGVHENYPSDEELRNSDRQVSEDVIEGILTKYFPWSSEEIRQKCTDTCHKENKTYDALDGLGGGPVQFIITDIQQKEDIIMFSYEC